MLIAGPDAKGGRRFRSRQARKHGFERHFRSVRGVSLHQRLVAKRLSFQPDSRAFYAKHGSDHGNLRMAIDLDIRVEETVLKLVGADVPRSAVTSGDTPGLKRDDAEACAETRLEADSVQSILHATVTNALPESIRRREKRIAV